MFFLPRGSALTQAERGASPSDERRSRRWRSRVGGHPGWRLPLRRECWPRRPGADGCARSSAWTSTPRRRSRGAGGQGAGESRQPTRGRRRHWERLLLAAAVAARAGKCMCGVPLRVPCSLYGSYTAGGSLVAVCCSNCRLVFGRRDAFDAHKDFFHVCNEAHEPPCHPSFRRAHDGSSLTHATEGST